MGNYISCTLSNTTGRQSRGTKVIFPTGEVRQFGRPINVAELMLETPNHFLVNSISLHIGRRFSALSADEDLELGNVYVMLPMRRLKSVVTPADMATLLITANSAMRRAPGGKARILPEAGVPPQTQPVKVCPQSEVPRLNLDDIQDDSIMEFKARLSLSRSRKPMLETIAEEGVCSR